MKLQLSLLAIGTLFLSSSWTTQIPANEFVNKSNQIKSTTIAEPGFNFFRAHRQTRFGVTSTWGFSSCANVSSFEVQRNVFFPIEDWAWETVTIEPCSGARSYKFTDVPVDPGYISYRVVAIMNDGSEIVSDVATIHIISH